MMSRRFGAGVAVLVLLLNAVSVPAQAEVRAEQVDAILKKRFPAGGPGAAVLVVQDGRVVFKKGHGLANLKKNVPITPRTNFELASVSKQFTAMAVMILHDRGKLSFDDELHKHLSLMPIYNKERPVRVRDLLQHTSGLPEYFDFKNIPARDVICHTMFQPSRQLHTNGSVMAS